VVFIEGPCIHLPFPLIHAGRTPIEIQVIGQRNRRVPAHDFRLLVRRPGRLVRCPGRRQACFSGIGNEGIDCLTQGERGGQ
jgi:hypothetical protein